MQTIQQRIEGLLVEGLGGETDLETLPDGHVCGHVISPRFEELDYEQRRALIKQVLSRLSRDEQHMVSTLLTYTPSEWSAVTSDTERN